MIKSRIAPTPSGYLHWGNLLNFTLAWAYTRKNQGLLQLRIDDVDATRSRPEYIEEIFQTLEWLGFDWDQGPSSPDDFAKNFSQGAKKEEYREWLKHFPGYACDCSRQSIQKRTESPYDGFCRDRNLDLLKDISAWRVRDENPINDIILWRKDDMPAYHLVSLVEDLRFETSLIIRGQDLKDSTAAQKRLAKMLGEQGTPFLQAQFIHHPLIFDASGNKLSKSAGSTSLKHFREAGNTSADAFRHLSTLAGWKDCVSSLQESIEKQIFYPTDQQ